MASSSDNSNSVVTTTVLTESEPPIIPEIGAKLFGYLEYFQELTFETDKGDASHMGK